MLDIDQVEVRVHGSHGKDFAKTNLQKLVKNSQHLSSTAKRMKSLSLSRSKPQPPKKQILMILYYDPIRRVVCLFTSGWLCPLRKFGLSSDQVSAYTPGRCIENMI